MLSLTSGPPWQSLYRPLPIAWFGRSSSDACRAPWRPCLAPGPALLFGRPPPPCTPRLLRIPLLSSLARSAARRAAAIAQRRHGHQAQYLSRLVETSPAQLIAPPAPPHPPPASPAAGSTAAASTGRRACCCSRTGRLRTAAGQAATSLGRALALRCRATTSPPCWTAVPLLPWPAIPCATPVFCSVRLTQGRRSLISVYVLVCVWQVGPWDPGVGYSSPDLGAAVRVRIPLSWGFIEMQNCFTDLMMDFVKCVSRVW